MVPWSSRSRRAPLVVAVVVALLALVVPLAGEGGAQEDEVVAPPASTPVLSARRVPGLVQGAVAGPALAAAVEGTIDRNPETWCFVAEDAGRPVVTVNPDLPLAPASVTKLFTATALLEHFGPDHTLRTVLAAAQPAVDGVIDGDLYLVGGGDPLWATSGYAQSFDDPANPWVDAGLIADALVDAGVREVRGNVVGDDSRHDGERWVASWPTRYRSDPSVGPISALNINDGFTGYVETPDQPNADRRAGDPPELAAQTLVTLLEQRGVAVGGGGVAGARPPDAVEVAGVDSRPMSELVGEMVLESDNNTAEMLVKELGLDRAGQGTTAAGLAEVVAVLDELGLPTGDLGLKDGSGLDPENRVTCGAVMAVLDHHGPDSLLSGSLAVAGQTGTLHRRMVGSPATGQVRAKTGTLNTVNALAGWADTSGARLTFVGLGNGNDPRGNVAADRFADALVSYPAAPPLAELGPSSPEPALVGPAE
nr:D-alanyl-D-alanine carboxypeptidase/D-alanyl-D-alanine-endopeptidase [Rhabdothermincola salaria]